MLFAKLKVRVSIPLQGALLLLQQDAERVGGAAIAAVPPVQRASGKVPNAMIMVELTAAQFLCAACDHFRNAGDAQAVAAIEELIADLKQGRRQHVLARMNLGSVQSVGQLDDMLEKTRALVLHNAGG